VSQVVSGRATEGETATVLNLPVNQLALAAVGKLSGRSRSWAVRHDAGVSIIVEFFAGTARSSAQRSAR
jgi:hypothetical protein